MTSDKLFFMRLIMRLSKKTGTTQMIRQDAKHVRSCTLVVEKKTRFGFRVLKIYTKLTSTQICRDKEIFVIKITKVKHVSMHIVESK